MNYHPAGRDGYWHRCAPGQRWLGASMAEHRVAGQERRHPLRFAPTIWTGRRRSQRWTECGGRRRKNPQWIIDNFIPWIHGPLFGADRIHVWTSNNHFVRGNSDPPFSGGLGHASVGTDQVDIGPPYSIDTPGFGAVNFVHELSHNTGMHHTATDKGELKSTSSGNVACDNSADSGTDWPYSNPKIQEYGIDPDTGVIYVPRRS